MFIILVFGKTATFKGTGKTEKEAVKDLERSPVGQSARNSSTAMELHKHLENNLEWWYERCEMFTEGYSTRFKGRFIITSFPV